MGVVTGKRGKAKRRRYFGEWWKVKGAEVKARRRQNYAMSSGLRRKARTRARNWRARQAARLATREVKAGERSPRGPCRPRTIEIDGKPVELFTIGVLLRRTGLARRTLLVWEERKIIPCGWLVDEFDRRWYPEEYVAFMEKVASMRLDTLEQGGSAWYLANFKGAVIDLWFKVRKTMPNFKGVQFKGAKHG